MLKYNIEVVQRPYPYVSSFEPMRTQRELCEDILRNKRVTIMASFQTKTSVSVSINSGKCSFKCSYIPNGCEDIKFHSTSGYNMWDGNHYAANYFKILKNQKWEKFKKYGTALVDSLGLPPTEEPIAIRFVLDQDVMESLEVSPIKAV